MNNESPAVVSGNIPSVSEIVWELRAAFRSVDFDRAEAVLTKREEALRRELARVKQEKQSIMEVQELERIEMMNLRVELAEACARATAAEKRLEEARATATAAEERLDEARARAKAAEERLEEAGTTAKAAGATAKAAKERLEELMEKVKADGEKKESEISELKRRCSEAEARAERWKRSCAAKDDDVELLVTGDLSAARKVATERSKPTGGNSSSRDGALFPRLYNAEANSKYQREESSNKRSTKSEVWDHFKKTEDRERAVCNYCKNIYACNMAKHGTSGLKRHMQTCMKRPHFNKGQKMQSMFKESVSLQNAGPGGSAHKQPILILDSDDDSAIQGNSSQKEPSPQVLKRKRSSSPDLSTKKNDQDMSDCYISNSKPAWAKQESQVELIPPPEGLSTQTIPNANCVATPNQRQVVFGRCTNNTSSADKIKAFWDKVGEIKLELSGNSSSSNFSDCDS